jgi:hypothetical protein
MGLFFTPENVTDEDLRLKAKTVIDGNINSKAEALNLSAETVKKETNITLIVVNNQKASVYINELFSVARKERDPNYEMPGELKEVLDQFFERVDGERIPE